MKWHGENSKPRRAPGGGLKGAYLGNLEYLAKKANCVQMHLRFKFLNILTTLEAINLLMVRLASQTLV